MHIPFLGRLSPFEWVLLVISFVISWAEYASNIITHLLPTPVLALLSATLRAVYRLTPSPIHFIIKPTDTDDAEDVAYEYVNEGKTSRAELMSKIMNAQNLQDLCLLFGYSVEPHIVRTDDGYLLTVQRVRLAGGQEGLPRNGKVVYLHHGLLMCLDIWVTMLDKNSNLPFVLYDLGYDVWLGNNRGNKYSQKHLTKRLDLAQFWDFSIDEFALFDIPNSITYILRETGAPLLTYVGFLQGTAQAFAAMSVNSDLGHCVDRIVAISPATTPHGLYSKFLDILLKLSPKMLFLMFSRKALLPLVMFWKRTMYPPFFDSLIDAANYMLFNWTAANIDKPQKICLYAHLYSTTSVKTVVHWFQIMAAKTFQMYHDVSAGMSTMNPVVYPLGNIRTPIHLIYGDLDSLVDIDVMRNQLPERHTTCHAVPGHEHLDNLWGRDVASQVFPLVLLALAGEFSTDKI